MSLESPPKPTRLTLPMQNGGSKVNGVSVNSIGKDPSKPWFFVSFLVDARGGRMHGKRHSGVDLIIPPSRVCMPTRITCKLIRKEKLELPPVLKEGEALASRIAELGPVGEKFLGSVLIELPHFASRIDGERELVILRSENGTSWHEHHSEVPSENFNKLISSANENETGNETGEKRTVKIYTSDFPRYFAAVTRIRQDSKKIGSEGGMVKSSISQAVVNFPQDAIGKDIKVGLQVLPIAPESIVRLMGQQVPMSAVTTIEPRRRKFHGPVTLSIPVPKPMLESIRKQKKDENPTVHILYSISGGNTPSQWEDITGSAPLNLNNESVSFKTAFSARYWLMDTSNVAIPVKAAGEIFQDAVKSPFLAKFFILAKQHSMSEAQVRVLCVTDDDIDATLERQEHFEIIGSTKDVEVFEGKSYYLNITGNFAPVAASGQELRITFYSFRVNRLSFVARLIDAHQAPSAQLHLTKELVVPPAKATEAPLFSLNVTLPHFDSGLVSPEMEPEQWRAKLEAAKLSLAQNRPPVSAALKLTDIAEALQGDWVPLAAQLGINQREVVKIQTEYGSAPEQAILMLHLWVEKHGIRATGSELERALRKIGRDDVIDQCIHDKRRDISAVIEDLDSLNPIDASFQQSDSPIGFQNVQTLKSENEHRPFVEVDEGVTYQVEEVWNGTEWHKTRIAVQKPEVATKEGAENELPVTEEKAPTLEASPKVSLSTDQQDVIVHAEAERIQTEQNGTEAQPLASPKVESEPIEIETVSKVPVLDGEFQPEVQPVMEEIRYSERVPDEIDSHASPLEAEIQSTTELTTGDQSDIHQPPQGNQQADTDHVAPPVEVTFTDSSLPAEDLLEKGPFVQHGITVGDPKVTTEVEEFEDVLDDGTVVKRKVVKTKQEQLVTECYSTGDTFDPAVSDTDTRHVLTDFDNLQGPGTVVETSEEILEDGTIVKHTLVKKTEQHVETGDM